MTAAFETLDEQLILDLCGRRSAVRGKALWAKGAVLSKSYQLVSNKLEARVQGSVRSPYQVRLILEDGAFTGYCTCPVAYDCKHVAAVLYRYLEQRSRIRVESDGQKASGSEGAPNSDDRVQPMFQGDPLDSWLNQLLQSQTVEREGDEQHFPGDELLVYELDIHRGSHSAPWNLKVLKSRLLRKGGLGAESPYAFGKSDIYLRCATSTDLSIFEIVESNASSNPLSWRDKTSNKISLEKRSGGNILSHAIASGRLYAGPQRSAPLTKGETRRFEPAWELADNMHYQLRISLKGIRPDADRGSGLLALGHASIDDPPAEITGSEPLSASVLISESSPDEQHWQLIPVDPPWYFDRENHQVGLITGAPEVEILQSLLEAPLIPQERAQYFSNAIASQIPDIDMPLPVKPTVHASDLNPAPLLILHSRDDSPDVRLFYATLMVAYGEWKLPLLGHSAPITVQAKSTDGSRAAVRRRPEAEMLLAQSFASRFPGMHPAVPNDPEFYSMADWQPALRDFSSSMQQWQVVVENIPELENEGWTVMQLPPFDVRIERVSTIQASIEEDDGGWFDMGLRITHAGHHFDLIPYVADWISDGSPNRPLMIKSEGGVYVEVPLELIRPIADTLLELFKNAKDLNFLRLSPARALTLNVLEDEWRAQGIESAWKGGEKLFALADQLADFSGIEHGTLPDTVTATLRPYQLDGVAWLGFLAKYGFNGILADDMGLGKTLQALAYLEQQRYEGKLEKPVLIVVPTSLLGNWEREAGKFTPEMKVRIWHGQERKSRPLKNDDDNLVVTSYALALRDRDMFAEHGFGYLILDEAQAIKNPSAKVAQAVKSLPIERRLCLTGTPLENHLHELWSQFDFLMPDLLGTKQHFGKYFRTPIENQGDTERQLRLNEMIRPFVLRRKKEEVASELPPKTEIIREVIMDGPQAALYESIRASMQSKVRQIIRERGLARSHIEMLEALLKLRQTCCHPDLVKLESAREVKASAKTDMLMDMLTELISEGKKVLLFSQFTEMLALIETQLKELEIPYVKLTGRTRNRDEVIDAFQEGTVPLFLISLRAGGTGLNLTAADTVIHYDPWWNPAVENQASDRAHRIGQTKPVFVYKLITKGTVEEKILEMQKKKQALADQTFVKGSEQVMKGLTSDDVLSLFSPLEEQ